MIRDPGKVVNLDRPREDEPEATVQDAPVSAPDTTLQQPDALDEIVSQFLEKANSLTADYESRHETTAEQLDELLSDMAPTPEVGRKMAELAAAMPPADCGAVARQPAGPPPSPAPSAELDEAIASTLDQLEALSPGLPDHSGEPSPQPHPVSEVEAKAESAPATAVAESLPGSAPARVAPAESHTSAPIAEQPPIRDMFDHRTPMPAKPRRTLTARILIRLAVIAVLVISGIVIYLLATSKPRKPPEPQPAAAETAGVPATAPVVPLETSVPAAQPEAAPPASLAKPQNFSRARTPSQPLRSQHGWRGDSGSRSQSIPRPLQTVEAQPQGDRIAVPQEVSPPQSQSAATHGAAQDVAIVPAPNASGGSAESSQAPARTEPDPVPVQPVQKAEVTPPVRIAEPPAGFSPSPAPASPPPKPVSPAAAAPTSPPGPAGTQAVLVSKVLPNFPEFARSRRMSGRVDLEIEIDAQGRVTSAKPVTGLQIFHSAAMDAVRKWRFRPATLGGNNVASQGKVTVVFNYQR